MFLFRKDKLYPDVMPDVMPAQAGIQKIAKKKLDASFRWHDSYWHESYWHDGYWHDGYWHDNCGMTATDMTAA